MQTPPPLTGPTRPKVLTVAAVISIVFGAFGILGSLPALLGVMGLKMPAADPVSAAMLADPVVQSFQNIAGVVGALTGILLLAAGVALLKCREWARKVVIGWSIYSVIATAIGTYVTYVHIMPAMQKGLQEQMKGMGESGAVGAKVAMAAGSIGAVVGLLFGVGLAITLIVLVTRPKAKAACQAITYS